MNAYGVSSNLVPIFLYSVCMFSINLILKQEHESINVTRKQSTLIFFNDVPTTTKNSFKWHTDGRKWKERSDKVGKSFLLF